MYNFYTMRVIDRSWVVLRTGNVIFLLVPPDKMVICIRQDCRIVRLEPSLMLCFNAEQQNVVFLRMDVCVLGPNNGDAFVPPYLEAEVPHVRCGKGNRGGGNEIEHNQRRQDCHCSSLFVWFTQF